MRLRGVQIIDKPTFPTDLMDGAWRAYAARVIDPSMPPTLQAMLRAAFYAGAGDAARIGIRTLEGCGPGALTPTVRHLAETFIAQSQQAIEKVRHGAM